MSSEFHIVIPCRMASERLPGKPLREIAGRPLIELVYRRALQADARSVIIATDSEEIRDTAQAFGARVVMTSAAHQSGSDRIAECARKMGWSDDTILVNLQGDEPLMPSQCLEQSASVLSDHADASVCSLYLPLSQADEVTDPNTVKVVTDSSGFALYFSRSVIPHLRGFDSVTAALQSGMVWKRHIGLYAYRVGALVAFTRQSPSPLESAERLEQLRFLENGHRIVMARACRNIPSGVDTPEDLERVRRLLADLD